MNIDKRYSPSGRLFRFIRFWLKAKNAHGVHSPFVFTLYTKVIRHQYNDERLREITRLHRQLRKSKTILNYHETKEGNINIRPMPVGKMIRHFAAGQHKGRLLYRLAKYFNPSVILELGTSLGISSMYIAAACPKSRLITIEACPESAKQAAHHHQIAGIKNINIINTNFDDGLNEVLDSLNKIDFVYIDGNHCYEAVKKYFKMLMPLLHNESILIFDDIHYSDGMQKAWKEICEEPRVIASIELYDSGLIFFRDGMRKQHFILI